MNAEQTTDFLSYEVKRNGANLTWDGLVTFAQDILRRHEKRNPEYAAQQRRQAAAMKLLNFLESTIENERAFLIEKIDNEAFRNEFVLSFAMQTGILSRSKDLIESIEQLPALQPEPQHEPATGEQTTTPADGV